ncbi:MAG: CinA family protein [Chloroflexi bacterium]|nr:CinA family protein [Chloroflexota bacterium]
MDVREIAELLVSKGQTVSVAEADTCGLIGYMLSTVPGSSRYFPGGVIAYTGGLKQKVLGVPDELYDTKGSVSPEMAIAMANGVRDLTGTDYGVSDTGVAGPTGGRSGLPIGTFYIGIAGPGGLEVAERFNATAGDRDGNKRQVAQAVLDLLGKYLKEAK